MSLRSSVLLIVTVCAVTFCAGLGTTALWEPDEPRFAEATRQMLLRGDFITPWFNDRPRFEKPVLLYWLQVPFFALLGDTETAVRLPSVLTGLLAVVAIFGIGRDLVSPRAGLLGALCLATTFRFVLYARQGLTDVPVTAAVAAGLWAMTRALSGGSAAAARLAWACAGAAILLKGPVGLLAPVIWTGWAWLRGGRQEVARTCPLSGVLIATAVAAPWFIVMLLLHGRAFFDVAIGYEVVARYVSEDFPGRDRGFFYFWGVWLGDGLPWSLFLVAAFWWRYGRKRELAPGEATALQLAGLWFLTVLLLFSVSQYKLPHYILPAYPAMALAVGVFVNAAIERRAAAALWRAPAYLTAVVLAVGAALTWLLMARAFELRPGDPSFVLPVLLAAGALLIGIVASPFVGSRPLLTFAAIAATLAVCFGTLGTFIATRELRRFQPIPPLAAAARQTVADHEPLAVAGNFGAPGLVFYARHPVRQLTDTDDLISYLSQPGRRHCVLPQSELEAVRPLINRPMRIQAEASIFSVRMRRLLESEPERAGRVLMLVTVE